MTRLVARTARGSCLNVGELGSAPEGGSSRGSKASSSRGEEAVGLVGHGNGGDGGWLRLDWAAWIPKKIVAAVDTEWVGQDP